MIQQSFRQVNIFYKIEAITEKFYNRVNSIDDMLLKSSLLRRTFLELSFIFRKLSFRSTKQFHAQAIADILYFYAFTYTYFNVRS